MFTVPDLPYAHNALEPHIDEETMHLHHDKHHAAYVKNLNDALAGKDEFLKMSPEELMKNLNKVPDDVRMKVRNNGGGHLNHTFFWESMGPKKGGEPTGKLMEMINVSFGDFAKFKEQFAAKGVGRFGSGWAWLIKDGEKLSLMDTPNQDNPWMEGKLPLLGLDVWEHAYYLKYQNRRPDYIAAWWNVVDWDKVSSRI